MNKPYPQWQAHMRAKRLVRIALATMGPQSRAFIEACEHRNTTALALIERMKERAA